MGFIFAVVFLVLMFVSITQRQPFPTGRAGEASLDGGGSGLGKSSSSAIPENFVSMAMQRYIVQLDSPPLITGIVGREKVPAERIPGAAVPRRAGIALPPPKGLSELRSELEREHNDVKGDVKELLDNALSPNILATGNAVDTPDNGGTAGNGVNNQNSQNGNSAAPHDYFYTFNGFTVDATPGQADAIGAIPGVKKVYPDLKVHEMLADSVPLINADKVWSLDAHGNDCRANGNTCLDGKGVTIGIIDTGVDYTHNDLGGSGSPSQEFLKNINRGISSSSLGDTLQVSDGKVYFLGGQDNQVYRYNPQDGTAIKATQNESLKHYSVFVHGKQLVSIFFSGTGYGILETNMETLEEKVLIPPTNLEMEISMQKTGQYLFFDVKTNYTTGQYQPGNPESKPVFTAYVYDFLARTLTLVITEAGITHRGLAMDGKVYYTGRQGNSIINVYDLSENRLLPEIDYGNRIVLLDASGTEILVNNFDLDRYELFNPETGEKQIIPQSANAAQGSAADEDVISDEAFAFLLTGDSAQLAVFNSQLVVYEPQSLRDKFEVFDRASNKVVSFQDLPQRFVTIMLEGNTICFSTAASEVYCFDYDPSYDYTGGMMANPFPNDKVIGGYDFVNNDMDPMDDRGHGTHVAATAAGNGVLKGVAPGAQIVAYKSLDQNGDGSFSQIISAIERSVDPNQDGNISDRLDIISLSLGANCREYNELCGPDDPLSQSIDK
ncbi:S8 family serine peptidase, partial [Candidatus Woesearchaeota archaeon]|nr:S8 family serine peptidase [Candidatus Woesearchaeota archaeon]